MKQCVIAVIALFTTTWTYADNSSAPQTGVFFTVLTDSPGKIQALQDSESFTVSSSLIDISGTETCEMSDITPPGVGGCELFIRALDLKGVKVCEITDPA